MANEVSLKLAYQGVLVGALLGDSIGAVWEVGNWNTTHPLEKVTSRIAELVKNKLTSPIARDRKMKYTDDSAMTLAMARSFVERKGFNARDLARKFYEGYHREPFRRYGESVVTVFRKLRDNPEDIFRPAREQHGGEGSYGNGSAMRVSPVALLCKSEEELIKCASESSAITHAHESAVAGGVLQALAVKRALDLRGQALDTREFIDYLLEKMEDVEKTKPGNEHLNSGLPLYKSQLETIKAFLARPEPEAPTQDEVYAKLGHGISAAEAVPCAVYSFLRCSSKTFADLIPYAISLGGDTDTIASMAGAIGGGYWGIEGIPPDWIKAGEATDVAVALADQIHDIVHVV